MAAPPEVIIKNLSGNWVLNKTLSDDIDTILKLAATISLKISQFEKDSIIYPLDDSAEGHHAIELTTDSAKAIAYVLKPQRKGSGNNIYGVKIPLYLATLGADQKKWRSYILMEMIRAPALKNFIFRNRQVHSGEVIGELDIFGICLRGLLRAGKPPYPNKLGGWMAFTDEK